MPTPPLQGQPSRGRGRGGRGNAPKSKKKGGNPNPTTKPPPKPRQTPAKGQTKSPFSGPRSPTPPVASPDAQVEVPTVASLPTASTAFVPIVPLMPNTSVPNPTASRAPTPISAQNASRGGSSSSSSNRPTTLLSLLKPTPTYAQLPVVETVSTPVPELYEAPYSSMSSSSEKRPAKMLSTQPVKSMPTEPGSKMIERCIDYRHYYDWLSYNFPELANHPTKWFINYLLKFNDFDDMDKYSNYSPEKWLAHLGNRNFHKFYHLIAELLVIWHIMMETFNPVPVLDYIGAREVLLSLFYEPLALLADNVP